MVESSRQRRPDFSLVVYKYPTTRQARRQVFFSPTDPALEIVRGPNCTSHGRGKCVHDNGSTGCRPGESAAALRVPGGSLGLCEIRAVRLPELPAEGILERGCLLRSFGAPDFEVPSQFREAAEHKGSPEL